MFNRLNKNYGGKKAFFRHVLNKIKYKIKYLTFLDPLPKSLKNHRIVFVCKGNICRSALAHQYLYKLGQLDTISFGLDTHSGKPANERILEISSSQGICLRQHVTTARNDYIFQENDILICMEPWQGELAKKLYPDAIVTLLGLQLIEKRPYIYDPYASCESWVYTCVDLIIDATNTLNQKINDSQN